jgi:hypothetical protein
MKDEQMQPLLEGWFKDREVTPADVRHSASQVMARLPEVRQRGRWWPLPYDLPAPIPTTHGPTPARGFTMFSAVKFVVAGVIVALFGGFLLAGVLTTQQGDEVPPAAVTESPSPMTSEELLLGMVTEEVEPGVFRVTSDGVRDLTSLDAGDIVAGYDDGIWLLREDGFLRLGSDGFHQWPAEVNGWPVEVAPEDHIFEVAPDGTMWVIPRWTNIRVLDPRRAPGLRSTDGEEWTVEPCPERRQYPDCRGFTVAPDGRVWALWKEGRWRVGHLGPAGWQPLDGGLPTEFRRLFFTDAGDIYGMKDGVEPLYRYEDGAWERFTGSWSVRGVGRDGTVWTDTDDHLDRFRDGEWEHWDSADLLPDIGYGLGLDSEFRVAPDGSLWSGLWQEGADSTDPSLCDGLARFDGETLERFLPGRCIAMDIAPDGSAWVLAADEVVLEMDGFWLSRRWALPDDQTWHLYVITPEAVAATE